VFQFDAKITGWEKAKQAVLQVNKETFEKWKEKILRRMEQMSDEINGEYAAVGKGSLGESTYIEESPNSIKLRTDTMILIYLEFGTKAHGPVTAKYLHFWIDGEEIFTKWVQGIKPHEIVKRAVERFVNDLNGWFRG